MRVFLAGATGAIASRLVPLLVSAGHDVIAMRRLAPKAGQLRTAGATPVVADALDPEAVIRVVKAATFDAIVHGAHGNPAQLAHPVVRSGLRDNQPPAHERP
ncbi:NAD(P)H-binding protein [Candidatus Methylacidithermus pantelleriae]|uniref:NAD-dependent epimerase/dehydratase n=1 Tax=Candidatus Methylacidithermus pantelleriae TaxID=2744239 RepID=A0A8J2BNR3_9BACT|nr:NAD(P)H-binding protein [Candidatus Methylacidithermus pantelleriae]CAF0699166.1 NAD-dependent epimerase/dehydratase [Candidatus Methylacidithermus pantelleriae]